MRFTVNLQECQNHGQCTITAPDTFSLDDATGELTFRQQSDEVYRSDEVAETVRPSIISAAAVCPMQAIHITS